MNFKEILSEAIDNNTKIILTGYSGWGKSEMIQQVAEEKGLELIDFRLSEVLPEDLVGIPKVKGDYYEYVPPKWLYDVVNNPDKKYLLFLDEITQGTPEVLNICYKIFDKITKVGNYTLTNVAVVGATNYQSESNYLSELPTPLKNRACMLELDKDIDRASNYLIQKYSLTSEIKPVLDKCIVDSNPRSTEKALTLIMNHCNKHLVIPYINASNYQSLNNFITLTESQSESLTDLEKARVALSLGFIVLNNKKYSINHPHYLTINYHLSQEESEIIEDEFASKEMPVVEDALSGFVTAYAITNSATLSSDELRILSEESTFNVYKYLKGMKLNTKILKEQLSLLCELTCKTDVELMRDLAANRILPIDIMRNFKDIVPWDILKAQKDKGWLTESKLSEFAKELA